MAAPNGLAHKPAYITKDDQRFLIMDAPTDQNLPAYIEECKKHNVHTVVRACEPTYSIQPLTKAGIEVMEMPFVDGEPPPQKLVDQWLQLVEREFASDEKEKRTLAIHCVAGLGRAPVLVVIALIESGMDPLDAIEMVRSKRRGAINAKQLKFLESYHPRKANKCCIIL